MITTGDKSGFSVSIQRPGGEAFNEYEVQQTEGGYARPSVTSCWLESKTDDTFEIKYEIQGETMRKHSPFDWSVHISVDGRTIKRSVLSYLTTGPSVHTVSSMNFMEYGVAYNGKLYFAPLQTTDSDEEVTIRGDRLQSLGKIRFDFLRGTMGAALEHTTVGCIVKPDVGVEAEKGKKLAGGIGCKDKQLALPQKSVNWKDHDEAVPYHHVEFNYRDRLVLQLRGVIEEDAVLPQIPTPPPVLRARPAGSSRKRRVEAIDIDEDAYGPASAQAGPSIDIKAEMLINALPTSVLPGPSKKRKAEVIDIEEEEENKPEVQARLSTRVGWLERQLQTANELLKRRRIYAGGDLVDLTGDE